MNIHIKHGTISFAAKTSVINLNINVNEKKIPSPFPCFSRFDWSASLFLACHHICYHIRTHWGLLLKPFRSLTESDQAKHKNIGDKVFSRHFSFQTM